MLLPFLHLLVNPLTFLLIISVPLYHEFDSPPDGNGTIDSIAIWVAPNPRESLVFLTDKTRDCVEVHSPVSKFFLRRIGSSGSGNGELSYPNGITVGYNIPFGSRRGDVLFVVERDNHRLSMFSLPEGEFVGHFGANDLEEPYGIALYWKGEQLQAWVTETGSSPDGVMVYDISTSGQNLTGRLNFSFSAAGSLESLVIDPVTRRALVCDEGDGHDIMVYDLRGNLLQRFGKDRFVNEPEGIVIYELGDGKGYIIVADQNASPTEFEVFDRVTYESLGQFTGETDGTDGIALTQAALPNLPQGSFYAINSDKTGHVYDWAEIAKAMDLQTNVTSPRTSVHDQPQANPKSFNLLIHPNPFKDSVRVRYRIDRSDSVRLQIFDVTGKLVRELFNGMRPPGEYEAIWEGRDEGGNRLATGSFFVRLNVGGQIESRRIVLKN